MNGLTWLIAANAAMWIGLGLWLVRLAVIQNFIARRIEHMESLRDV